MSLLSVARKHKIDAKYKGGNEFPFSVPTIRTLPTLDLSAPVTMFVGENGSGKSTLLEGIAAGAELPTVGGTEISYDDSLGPQRVLASTLRLSWSRRSRKGFFLRAEDFFGYLKRMARDDARIARELTDNLRAEVAPLISLEGSGAHVDEIAAAKFIRKRDVRSHGESFMDLFRSRVQPGGLYLLDEPEAPLSPTRQLALLALIHSGAATGAQFVIATHSPILLAYPGARIYGFDSVPIRPITYEELEHVSITREFLNEPAKFLRHLV